MPDLLQSAAWRAGLGSRLERVHMLSTHVQRWGREPQWHDTIWCSRKRTGAKKPAGQRIIEQPREVPSQQFRPEAAVVYLELPTTSIRVPAPGSQNKRVPRPHRLLTPRSVVYSRTAKHNRDLHEVVAMRRVGSVEHMAFEAQGHVLRAEDLVSGQSGVCSHARIITLACVMSILC